VKTCIFPIRLKTGHKLPVNLSRHPTPRDLVRRANNLQTVHFHLLIAEHAHAGRRYGTQIFAVVSKLLMIFPLRNMCRGAPRAL
jgi:hypothetical protein